MNSNVKDNSIADIPPAFLCDTDGSILIANKKAEENALISLLKTNISEYISSADTLRYDIAMKSKKPRPFIAAAKLVCGKRFLAVIPNSISDCRVAVVAVEKSEAAARKRITSANFFTMDDMRLLCQRLEGIDTMPGTAYNSQLFDTGKALRLVTDKIATEGTARLSFNILRESYADGFMCSCGLEGFVSVTVAVIFALDKLSTSGIVDISVDEADKTCRITLETEIDKGYVSRSTPSGENLDFSHLHLDFLRFASECSDCTLDISIKNSRIKITTVFSEVTEDIDFKSNDPFANLEDILEASISAIHSIYREEDQE